MTRRYDITRDDRCATSSTPSGSAPTPTSPSPAGPSRACGSTTSRSRSRWRSRPSTRACGSATPSSAARSSFRRTACRSSGSMVRTRSAAFASAQWNLRRLTPWGQELTFTGLCARRRLSHRQCPRHGRPHLSRDERLAHAGDRGARRRREMAVLRTGVRRHPEFRTARPVRTDASDAEPRHPERGRAVDRPWRTATSSRSTAFRATTGGKTDRASPMASTGRSTSRTCRSSPPSGKAIGSRAGRIFSRRNGLTDRWSDIVGRTRIRYGRFIDITHRFRVDKDNLDLRRDDSTSPSAATRPMRRSAIFASTATSTRRRGPARQGRAAVAGRIKFQRYWSIFGATVIDLTDKSEDPLSLSDGWEPVRHRLGFLYEDECIGAWGFLAARL